MSETLLTPSNILLYGRVVVDLQLVPDNAESQSASRYGSHAPTRSGQQ